MPVLIIYAENLKSGELHLSISMLKINFWAFNLGSARCRLIGGSASWFHICIGESQGHWRHPVVPCRLAADVALNAAAAAAA